MDSTGKTWTLKISLTEKCNYSCFYCNDGDVNPKKTGEKLSEEELLEIIKAAHECGVENIQWTGGECTILDLPKFVKYAKEIGYKKQALTTNAFLLSGKIDELAENGLDRVNVSLDSLNKDTYKEITGVDGLDKVKVAIRECHKRFKPIKINIALMNKNIGEIKDFINFGRSLGDNVVIKFHELWKFKPKEVYKKEHVSEEEIYKKISSVGNIEEIKTIKGNNPTIKYYNMLVDGENSKIGISPLPKSFRCGGPSCSKIRVYSTGRTCEGKLLLNTSYEEKINYIRELMKRRCTTCIQR